MSNTVNLDVQHTPDGRLRDKEHIEQFFAFAHLPRGSVGAMSKPDQDAATGALLLFILVIGLVSAAGAFIYDAGKTAGRLEVHEQMRARVEPR